MILSYWLIKKGIGISYTMNAAKGCKLAILIIYVHSYDKSLTFGFIGNNNLTL